MSRYFVSPIIETKYLFNNCESPLIIKCSSIEAVWEKKLNTIPASSQYRVQVNGKSIFNLTEEEGKRVQKAWVAWINQ